LALAKEGTLDDLGGLRDLHRLRFVGVVVPVVFLALFEAFRVGVIDPNLDPPASNVAAAALGVVAALAFGLLIFFQIERAQRAVARRNRDLAIVNGVAAATQGELDVDTILQRALQRIVDATGAREAAVTLYPVDPAAGPIREVNHARLDRAGDALTGPEETVELGLTASGTPIGRLRIQLLTARLDDLPSVEALRMLGDRLATALHIGQLVADLQSRRRDDQTFYEALVRISEQAPLAGSLSALLDGARDRLGAEQSRICLTPQVLEALELDPVSEAAITAGVVCESPVDRVHDGPAELAGASRQHACVISGNGDRATLRAPLWSSGELLGDLWVARSPDPPFTERDRRYLFTLAGIAAMAIAATRIRKQERQGAILAERDRIARELHDSLAQVLGSTHLRLRHLLAGTELEGRPAVASELEELADVAEEAYRDVREAILGLREASRPRGFFEALQAYVEKYSVQSGVQVVLETSTAGQPSLTMSGEIQVLRVIQEALTNVRKHARASTARVRVMDAAPAGVMIAIEDDGRGFDPGEMRVHRDGGYGLQTMRERMELAGGSLRVESSPNHGTRVIAMVPASQNARPAPVLADHR
jgi:two-component system nitrate/nitrite sensor histidine kinase NarX